MGADTDATGDDDPGGTPPPEGTRGEATTAGPAESPLVETVLREVGFHTPVEPAIEPDRGIPRVVASAALFLVGLALLVPNATMLFTRPQPPVGTGLALFGTVLSALLTGGGYALYRSNFSDPNAVRIAAWAVVGLAVFGATVAGVFAYQAAGAGRIEEAPFTFAVLLTVGTAALALAGVYDARRVRAERQLAGD